MDKKKIIFCGTPNIAVGILETLINMEQIEVAAVITQPDKLVGRKKELTPPPVKILAEKNNLKVFQPAKIKDIFAEIEAINADAMVTCAFGQFVPDKILNLFKYRVNVHGSLLPKYRGGSPIQYAILNGDEETGITLMQMVKAMDAGPMFVSEKLKIEASDDSGTLFEKMTSLGKKMIEKYLIDILEGKIEPKDQNDNEATFAYNMIGEAEKIDWTKSAVEIVNFVRAMSPKPIAFTFLKDERWKIAKARVVGSDEPFLCPRKMFFPGEVMAVDKEGIFIQTGQGIIKILEIQRPGKKMVSAGTFKDPNSGIGFGTWFDPKIPNEN